MDYNPLNKTRIHMTIQIFINKYTKMREKGKIVPYSSMPTTKCGRNNEVKEIIKGC